MFSGFVKVNRVEESEDWCSEESPIMLNIQVSVEGSAGIVTKDMSYNEDVVF